VGSINFLEEEFERFLQWISGELGNSKQQQLAQKIEHIFILGDLVEGVGVYPGQDEELEIKDIFEQYKVCARFLKKIPSRIKLIIIPGNHDAVRLAEPQPPLYKDLAAPIWKLPNTIMLPNPATVNIMSSDSFPGFNFLLYHGYSFIYYADNVDSIRKKGGVDRADLIMRFLLQRRHLAPTHASTLYIPSPKQDGLMINQPPDFFVTGHLHKSIAANYKSTTTISGSCWQAKTSFMEKLGIHPEPARVPVVNLQTREVKILKFGK
jgi:DNA polymerase II small subunit